MASASFRSVSGSNWPRGRPHCASTIASRCTTTCRYSGTGASGPTSATASHTLQRFVHWRADPLRAVAHPASAHPPAATAGLRRLRRDRARPELSAQQARRQTRSLTVPGDAPQAARRRRVVAITELVASDIRRELATSSTCRDLQVVHNGVTDSSAAPREGDRGHLADGVPFLLHVSRMAPSKNIRGADSIWPPVWPEQRFVFAGADSTYVAEVGARSPTAAWGNVRHPARSERGPEGLAVCPPARASCFLRWPRVSACRRWRPCASGKPVFSVALDLVARSGR